MSQDVNAAMRSTAHLIDTGRKHRYQLARVMAAVYRLQVPDCEKKDCCVRNGALIEIDKTEVSAELDLAEFRQCCQSIEGKSSTTAQDPLAINALLGNFPKPFMKKLVETQSASAP